MRDSIDHTEKVSKQKKYLHRYTTKDIASILDELIEQIQTPDGDRFIPNHVAPDTVMLKVGIQSFIISITEKDKLS